tara:strand:+ start:409 stop:867 length:459 start_codon:yes stop_codon:yes gene_type:complete
MKISMSDLKRIIKEESSPDSEEASESNEQYQPGRKPARNAAEYVAAGHKSIFLKILGKAADCDALWSQLDKQVRNYERFSGEPITPATQAKFDYWLFIGQVCRTWTNNSTAEKVMMELEEDGIIAQWGSTEENGFYLSGLNGALSKWGCAAF